MFEKVKAYVTDHGDMSVGLFPCTWEVDCPFYKDDDKETQESFREGLSNLYTEFADSRVTVDFDYELKGEDNETI